MMDGLIILNPYANRWEAGHNETSIFEICNKLDLRFDCETTRGPMDGLEIARQAAMDGRSPIIAAGGDGTIGEILNGIFSIDRDQTIGPIGILPLGTANDLVTNLGYSKSLFESLQTIRRGATRRIDLGKVNDWVFANNSAIRLEPIVSLYNIQMRWARGTLRYLLAALRAIWDNPAWNVEMDWEQGAYSGPMSLVSVGNGALTGGIFKMAPGAKLDDGALTFVHGYAPGRRRMLSLLPRAVSGNYVEDPDVHQHHASWLRIRTDPGSPLQADGEIRSDSATDFEYEVLPSHLEIFCP